MRHIKTRRFSQFLVIVLLLASIGVNIFLFRIASAYYADIQRVRFNPIGLESFYDESYLPSEETRIVFYGDSRAAQWPSPAVDGVEFVNRGIGAQTSNQILLRYDHHVTPLQPDILLVQMCINELKTVPIFETRRQQITESCQHNTRQIIENARQTDTTVILTTVFPVGHVPLQRRLFWSDDVAAAVDETNAFLRQQSAENVIIFDTFALLADETGHINSDYAFDTLHLNAAGYDLLNAELIKVLEPLLRS